MKITTMEGFPDHQGLLRTPNQLWRERDDEFEIVLVARAVGNDREADFVVEPFHQAKADRLLKVRELKRPTPFAYRISSRT